MGVLVPESRQGLGLMESIFTMQVYFLNIGLTYSTYFIFDFLINFINAKV